MEKLYLSMRRQIMWNKLLIYIFLLLNCFFHTTLAVTPKQSQAILLKIDGGIGPATADYIIRGIEHAQESNAKLIILQIDTPGGLDKSMRSINKAILASSIPVVSFVYPSGSRAASAGTFILYASHIAAMAPGTNLGAAAPVSIEGQGTLPGEKTDKNKQDTKTNDTAEKERAAMMAKIQNDAIAYIQGLAQLRKRNAKWAATAITQAASIPAEQALKLNVIDLIANDIPDLLTKINNRVVNINNQSYKISSINLQVEYVAPDWRTEILTVITDPSIAYVLLLLGIYGLFFEFFNPGFVLPGVTGAICLLIALYALQLLPINYAGLGLIVLGLIFLIAETFMPSFGVLGFGGIIAFVIGSFFLFDTSTDIITVNWYIILIMAILNIVFFIGVIGMILRNRRKPAMGGHEALINQIVIVTEDFTRDGWVKLGGEIWRAHSKQPVKKGDRALVVGTNGLILEVEVVTK